MTNSEFVTRNILLSGIFNRYVLAHPDILNSIPEGAHVIILPPDEPELADYNTQLAKDLLSRGEEVVLFRTRFERVPLPIS